MTKFLARCDCCCCCCPSNQKIFACFFKISRNTHKKKIHYEITDRVCVCECGCVCVCVHAMPEFAYINSPENKRNCFAGYPSWNRCLYQYNFLTTPRLSLPLFISLVLPGTIWSTSNRSYALSHNVCTHTRCECGVAVYFAPCLHTTVISRDMQRQSQCGWNKLKNLISCRRSLFLKELLDFPEKKLVSRWRTWFPIEELNFSI